LPLLGNLSKRLLDYITTYVVSAYDNYRFSQLQEMKAMIVLILTK